MTSTDVTPRKAGFSPKRENNIQADEIALNISERFKVHDREYSKFENIPREDRLHPLRDICAMLYLCNIHRSAVHKMIASAEHDRIWFDFDQFDKLTSLDILYLTRCGVSVDLDSLTMNI